LHDSLLFIEICRSRPKITDILDETKKPHISVRLSLFAPQGGLLSNQFWDELRVYATLNYLFIQLMNNREVGLILIGLSIL